MLIFFCHAMAISISALLALRLGQDALVTLVSLQVVLANMFILKQTTLGGFTATCTDAFTIGTVLCLNLLQEYFGKKAAQRALYISFAMLLFYTLMSQLHLLYMPDVCDTAQPYYQYILGLMPRITIASMISYGLIAQLDITLYGMLNRWFDSNYLVLRNYISLGFSQLLDTILFSYLGLYGIVDNLWHIIAISYAIKVATIVLATPLVTFSGNRS